MVRKRTKNNFFDAGMAIFAILLSLILIGFLSSVIENNHRSDDYEPDVSTESPVIVARRESLKTVSETFLSLDMSSINTEHASELTIFRDNIVSEIKLSDNVLDIRLFAENFVTEITRQYNCYYASDFRNILLSEFDYFYMSDIEPIGDFANYIASKYNDLRYNLEYKVTIAVLSRELLESYKTELCGYAEYIEKNYIFGSYDNVVGVWELR